MKRKIAYTMLYSGLVLFLVAMAGFMSVAAQNYTSQYYTHLFNSLIDNTAIGSTTPSTGAFSYTTSVGNSTAPTAQGAYTMWNLTGGVGEMDLVDLKGSGTGGWWFENGFGTVVAHLTPSSFFMPGITLATAPSICPSGQKASGIDVNGNAAGCSATFTQAAIISGCDAPAGTYQTCGPLTVTWPIAFADSTYAATCTPVDANAGPGDSTNESGIVYINGAKSAGSMTVWVQNNRGSFDFNPSTIDCTATHL